MNEKKLAVGTLSRGERRACTAHWVDGLTHAEIGRGEGVSKWASMKRVQRARRKLSALGLKTPRRKAAYRTPAFQLGMMDNV